MMKIVDLSNSTERNWAKHFRSKYWRDFIKKDNPVTAALLTNSSYN